MKKIIIKITSIILVISVLVFQFGMLVSARIEREFDFSKLVYSETLSRYLYDGNGVYIHKSNSNDKRSLFDGAAYYVVCYNGFTEGPFKNAVFYGGDGTKPNRVLSNTDGVLFFQQVVDVSGKKYIERLVFTDNYIITPRNFTSMNYVKEIIFLNDAEITLDNTVFIHDTPMNYIIYGTTQNHRDLAERINHPFHDLNDVVLDVAEGTSVIVDETNCVISGLTPKTTADSLIRNCLSPKACDAEIEKEGYVGTGDKVNLIKWLDDSDAGSYDILLYGDVDSDGIYDARDAYLVNLMANGLLTEEQVGSLKWSAADCNHDGLVDSSDVMILQKAGVLLAQVNQSESDTDIEENQAYQDYIELIDQNPAVEDKPVEEPEPEVQPASLIDRIIEFIKKVVDFFRSIISKF